MVCSDSWFRHPRCCNCRQSSCFSCWEIFEPRCDYPTFLFPAWSIHRPAIPLSRIMSDFPLAVLLRFKMSDHLILHQPHSWFWFSTDFWGFTAFAAFPFYGSQQQLGLVFVWFWAYLAPINRLIWPQLPHQVCVAHYVPCQVGIYLSQWM